MAFHPHLLGKYMCTSRRKYTFSNISHTADDILKLLSFTKPDSYRSIPAEQMCDLMTSNFPAREDFSATQRTY
jgi:hypothetical protein